MTDFKEILCSLCFTIVTDKSFEVIEDVIKNIPDFHLLRQRLKFDGETKEVICKTCRRNLNAASEFKSVCLNTEDTVISYMGYQKMLQLDLREVYMKQEGNKPLMGTLYDHKICRLCMQPVKCEFKCIHEKELDVIQKFVPEMNISIVKDPIVCKTCFDSLCTHSVFLNDCLEIKKKVSICGTSTTESKTDVTSSDCCIKTENFETGMEIMIKTEYVDIKLEEEERSSTISLCLNNEPFENSDCKDAQEEEKCNNESLYKCDVTSEVRMYTCDMCDYETKHRTSINRHRLKHKDISDVQIYNCNDCDYRTKYKSDLTRHQKNHESTTEARMHKCNVCDYKTKYKYYLVQHALQHKDTSQVPIYKCEVCRYQSKFKKNLTRHQVAHKDPSEIPMYKCNDCDYKAKHKNSITHHVLTHKDPSQVPVYKCDVCGYETKRKTNFGDHLLVHRDPSEMQLYNCDLCGFQTKRKRCLKSHKLSHKELSEVPIYLCDLCDFKTKYKNSLKCHKLKHNKKLVVFTDV